MTITANGKGEVKGYFSNPQADLPPRPTGRPDVANLVGKGSLRVKTIWDLKNHMLDFLK